MAPDDLHHGEHVDEEFYDDAGSFRTALSQMSTDGAHVSVPLPAVPLTTAAGPSSQPGTAKLPSTSGAAAVAVPISVQATGAAAPAELTPPVQQPAPTSTDGTAPATDAAKEGEKAVYVDPGFSEEPLRKTSPFWAGCCWCYSCLMCCVQWPRFVRPQAAGGGFYALVHAWVCSFSLYSIFPYK